MKIMSQEQFFKKEIERIRNCKDSIEIFGYDAPFMSKKEYTDALKETASKGVHIEMTLSEKDSLGELEELAKIEGISITRIKKKFYRGYKRFDEIKSFWDSTEKTPYKPEENTVYLREVTMPIIAYFKYNAKWLGKHLTKKFDKLWAKAEPYQ